MNFEELAGIHHLLRMSGTVDPLKVSSKILYDS